MDDNNEVGLRSELDSLLKLRQVMADINAHYQEYGTIEGAPHMSEEESASIAATLGLGDVGLPFPAWALRNNEAEIKRVEGLLAL